MINGASPITFQLKASFKHSSSTLRRRRAFDRLRYPHSNDYFIQGPSFSSCPYTLQISNHKYLYMCVYVCKKKSLCHHNKCEFITVRLRAVQRANAHYYIDAGLTPPYTQQSIKSRGDGGGAADQNHRGWKRRAREDERKISVRGGLKHG